jgi:hypothetical protein
MVAKKVLLALIVTTTATFASGYGAEGEYITATLSIASGIAWLLLEFYDRRFLNSIFFFIFTILAILGCLKSMSALILLIGFITDLAAWDLSRFLHRSANLANVENKAGFEKRHLYRLSLTIGAGFLLALPPIFITFPLNFVIVFFITLLAMIVLSRFFLYVYRQNEKGG